MGDDADEEEGDDQEDEEPDTDEDDSTSTETGVFLLFLTHPLTLCIAGLSVETSLEAASATASAAPTLLQLLQLLQQQLR